MGAFEISGEDWKIIKKYTKEKILRQFSKEELLQQPKKDLFHILLSLIICGIVIGVYLLDKSYYNRIDYYINILLFIPLIIVFSVMLLYTAT